MILQVSWESAAVIITNFQRETGICIQDYVNDIRIERAANPFDLFRGIDSENSRVRQFSVTKLLWKNFQSEKEHDTKTVPGIL